MTRAVILGFKRCVILDLNVYPSYEFSDLHYVDDVTSCAMVLNKALFLEPMVKLTALPKDNFGYAAATTFYYGFLRLVLPGNHLFI